LGLIQVVNRETSEVQAVIPVGQQPQAIVLGGGGQRAYVANSGSGTVSVIDLGTMAVTDTINVGAGAATLALVP
jgi:YVTN family beta-propeller protein